MAEASRFWTTGAGGDGATAYSDEQIAEIFEDHFGEGVFAGVLGALAVSAGSGQVSVAAGVAIAAGRHYRNTSAVALPVPTPQNGTTGHRVVLRVDYPAKTVRLALKSSPDGTGAAPALTRNRGALWEVGLYTLSVTTGGVISLTDTRPYAKPRLASGAVTSADLGDNSVGSAELANGAVTAAKLAADSVGPEHIKPDSVGTSELIVDAVATENLRDGSVTGPKLANGAVGTAALANSAVTGSKIALNTIVHGNIGSGAVGRDELAISVVTTNGTGRDMIISYTEPENVPDGTVWGTWAPQ